MRSPRFFELRTIHLAHLLTVALLWGLVAPVPAQSKPKPLPSPTVERPTEPKAPEGARVFCVFGDTRPDGDRSRLQITRRLASCMAEERPEVVIGTGDYIDGAATATRQRQLWDDFLASIKPLQKHGTVPVAAAAGNHDVGGGMGDIFATVMGRRYYSFDIGPAHFIILDTERAGERGMITGEQWDWLCRDLQAAQGARHIFVTLHQPLFPVATHRGSSLDKYPRTRDRLHLLLAQMKVSAVFMGHEHLYHHQERDGVHYFITAGGGAPLYATEAEGGFHHYLKVTYTDSEYTVVVKRL